MHYMDHIPDEIVVNILMFVKDRIYVSMVSHRMMSLLNLMHRQCMISDDNDPYYLKKEYGVLNIIGIQNKILKIKNHNCLNYIYRCVYPTIRNVVSDNGDKIKSVDKWKLFGDNRKIPYMLFIQYLDTNNLKNEKNVCILIKYCLRHTDAFGTIFKYHLVVSKLIKYKKINILKYLGYKVNIVSEWIKYYRDYNKPKPLNAKRVAKEFVYFIENNITTLNYVYRHMINVDIPIKNDIIQYLNTKIDPRMLELLAI